MRRSTFHPMSGYAICPLCRACCRIGGSVRHQQSPPGRGPWLAVTDMMRHMMDKRNHAPGGYREVYDFQRPPCEGVGLSLQPADFHGGVVIGSLRAPFVRNAVYTFPHNFLGHGTDRVNHLLQIPPKCRWYWCLIEKSLRRKKKPGIGLFCFSLIQFLNELSLFCLLGPVISFAGLLP